MDTQHRQAIARLQAQSDQRHRAIDDDSDLIVFLQAIAAAPDPVLIIAGSDLTKLFIRRAASELLADHHLRCAHRLIDGE